MSFTDETPRVATLADTIGPWSGSIGGVRFRCELCGHRFVVGDTWRIVYAGNLSVGQMGIPNALVCGSCDGPDVTTRLEEHWREAVTRFWHLFEDADLRRAEGNPRDQ